MKAFNWNAGGQLPGGKPWSVEAPTDSALVLYLFAAFLAAPHWDFPKVGAGRQAGSAWHPWPGLPKSCGICAACACPQQACPWLQSRMHWLLTVPFSACALQDDVTELGPAGPLYLGKLPTRVADEYLAILSYRPPQGQQVCVGLGVEREGGGGGGGGAWLLSGLVLTPVPPPCHRPQGSGIVGLLLGSQQPHFSLLLRGDTVLTLTEQFGVLRAIVLLVLHAKQAADGFLGPRSLQFLRLQKVVRPTGMQLLGGRLFGLW